MTKDTAGKLVPFIDANLVALHNGFNLLRYYITKGAISQLTKISANLKITRPKQRITLLNRRLLIGLPAPMPHWHQ